MQGERLASKLRPGAWRSRPLDLGGDDRFQVHVVQQLLGLAAARQLDHVVDEAGDVVDLLDQVALQLGLVAFGKPSPPRSSSSRLALRLASGVRSSCEASETIWRCASEERCRASRVAL